MQTDNRIKSHSTPTADSTHSHGCCGSHTDFSPAGTETPQELLQQGVLDVRLLPPKRRHSLIFEIFDGLQAGGSFALVNDHDPKPLYYVFAYERAGTFTWNYEEQGPAVWRVRIGKTKPGSALNGPDFAAR